MFAKVAILACLLGVACAGALYNAPAGYVPIVPNAYGGYGAYGYAGYGGYNGYRGLNYAGNPLTGYGGYTGYGPATSYVSVNKEISDTAALPYGISALSLGNVYGTYGSYGGYGALPYGYGYRGIANKW